MLFTLLINLSNLCQSDIIYYIIYKLIFIFFIPLPPPTKCILKLTFYLRVEGILGIETPKKC